ncbi:MAG: SLC13 family permease [Desulfobacterales bacterium]
MRKLMFLHLTLVLIMLCTAKAFPSNDPLSNCASNSSPETDSIYISGSVSDTHNEPVDEAEVYLYDDQDLLYHGKTARYGKFIAHLQLPSDKLKESRFRLTIRKTSFIPQSINITATQFARVDNSYHLNTDIVMPRLIGPAFWISTIIFFIAYALISFEMLHRTIAAMLGAAILLAVSYTIGTIDSEFRIYSYEAAINSIDMNVIFLLMGMMVIVGILKNTGVFQWCAYISYKMAKGNVFILAVYLMIFTAVTSALLDNVTTMLLLTSVAIEICLSLSISPLVLLVPLILASNVGGTATLIGDPPNIMIGSYAGLSFLDFVIALTGVCLLSMAVLIGYTKLVWGKDYRSAKVQDLEKYIQEMKKKYRITDPVLLTYGLAVLGFVVFLFLSHGYWHMEVSVAALFGASILLTIAVLTKKVDLIKLIEKDIEWTTLMFFIFLFMLVGAVESSGLLALIADWILDLSRGNFIIACSLIIWVAAIMSAFVDNIPFTATMMPIVAYLSIAIPDAENTLWWALALGACFGGNGTIIGASANVVTIGIAESRGYKISFLHFMKLAFPYMIISVLIAHAWLIIFRPA